MTERFLSALCGVALSARGARHDFSITGLTHFPFHLLSLSIVNMPGELASRFVGRVKKVVGVLNHFI